MRPSLPSWWWAQPRAQAGSGTRTARGSGRAEMFCKLNLNHALLTEPLGFTCFQCLPAAFHCPAGCEKRGVHVPRVWYVLRTVLPCACSYVKTVSGACVEIGLPDFSTGTVLDIRRWTAAKLGVPAPELVRKQALPSIQDAHCLCSHHCATDFLVAGARPRPPGHAGVPGRFSQCCGFDCRGS